MEKLKKIGQNETKQDKLIASANPESNEISITREFTNPYTRHLSDDFCDNQIPPPLPPKRFWVNFTTL